MSHEGSAIVFFVSLALVLGVLFKRYVRLTAVSHSVLLYCSGFAIGQLLRLKQESIESLGLSIAWIDPELFVIIFLPVIIYEGAARIHLHTLGRLKWSISLLAGPGSLFATVVLAILCHTLNQQWSWVEAALLGAILSTTDPISVGSILKTASVDERLRVLIEGESLVNDASCLILFQILKSGLAGNSVWQPLEFLRLSVMLLPVSMCFGWAMGRVVDFFTASTFNDAFVEVSLTLFGAYLDFYVANNLIGGSGVLSIVGYALTLNYRRADISPDVEPIMHQFWQFVAFFANTLVFVLIGMLPKIIYTRSICAYVEWIDFGFLIIMYFGLNLSRFMFVMPMIPAFDRLAYPMSWQKYTVLSWCGLRGALSLALAIDIKETHTGRFGSLLAFYVGGLVLLTTVLNGMLLPKLIKLLRLSEISAGRALILENAIGWMRSESHRHTGVLQLQNVFADAHWEVVRKMGVHSVKSPFGPVCRKKALTPEETELCVRTSLVRAFQLEINSRFRSGLALPSTVRRLLALCDKSLDTGETMDLSIDQLCADHMNPMSPRVYSVLSKIRLKLPLVGKFELNRRVANCFDLGCTFCLAQAAVLDRFHLIVTIGACNGDANLQRRMLTATERSISTMQKHVLSLSAQFPEIVLSVKTKMASRTALNAQREAVHRLKERGILEEDDCELLTNKVEEAMVKLNRIPPRLALPSLVSLLEAHPWFDFITVDLQQAFKTAEIQIREAGSQLNELAELFDGLAFLSKGIVRIEGPDDHVDFIGPGQMFNVLAVISGHPVGHYTFFSQTEIEYIVVPREAVLPELYNGCPCIAWHLVSCVAVRIVNAVLSRHLPYASWGATRTLHFAERGTLLDFLSKIVESPARTKPNLPAKEDVRISCESGAAAHLDALFSIVPVELVHPTYTDGDPATLNETADGGATDPHNLDASTTSTTASSSTDHSPTSKTQPCPLPPSGRRSLPTVTSRHSECSNISSFRHQTHPHQAAVSVRIPLNPAFEYMLIHGEATYLHSGKTVQAPSLLRGTSSALTASPPSMATLDQKAGKGEDPVIQVACTPASWVFVIPKNSADDFDDFSPHQYGMVAEPETATTSAPLSRATSSRTVLLKF